MYPRDYPNPQNFPFLYKERIVCGGNQVENKNFVGGVGAEPNITVRIGNAHVLAFKGIFKEPTPFYSGEREIYYISKFLGEMKDFVIKDKRYYHYIQVLILRFHLHNHKVYSIVGNQINLNWNANYELDLKGYNVYRKINYQEYEKINLSPLTTTYTDNIPDAQFVIYRVTAVDITNYESIFSDPPINIFLFISSFKNY